MVLLFAAVFTMIAMLRYVLLCLDVVRDTRAEVGELVSVREREVSESAGGVSWGHTSGWLRR